VGVRGGLAIVVCDAGRRGFYIPYKMSKKWHFEGISKAFWIFLYKMSQEPFDPLQGPFDPSPLLVGVRAYSRQPISFRITLNVAVTWHPKQSHPVVIRGDLAVITSTGVEV
jgi:hypothetical protein